MFDDLRDLYQDVILDRGRKPRHQVKLDVFDATAKGDNPMCGDRVQVWLKRDAGGRISGIGFQARGCAISIASADLMSEAVAGLDAAQVKTLAAGFARMAATGTAPEGNTAMDTLKPLAGVHEFPSRVKCATLAWNALTAALDGAQETSSE